MTPVMERPLSGELFAGVGGLERGVEEVFRTRAAFFAEVDKAPSRVLEVRYPGVPNLGDVTKIRWVESGFVGRIRVLSGGFPCTDVSLAGRQAGMKGTRSGLWSEFARAIDELRPDWVVIENVPGLFSTDAFGFVEQCPWCVGDDGGQPCLRALGAVLADLAGLGFDAEWVSVPASAIGAPHKRKRVFILAWPSALSGGGGGGRWASGSESSGRDDASHGSDQGSAGGRRDSVLMPTPVVSDAESAARHTTTTGRSHSGTSLTDAVRLLPTPEAKLSLSGPDFARAGRESSGGDDLTTTLWKLLPTPTSAVADGGQRSRSGDRKDEPLLGGIAAGVSDNRWGEFQAAVDQWAEVLGRPAPAPMVTGARGGRVLNPAFLEWMLGWPEGWVTDPALGLTAREQSRTCGNGVVSQQAAYALRVLLSREGVPDIGWELVA